MNTPAANRCIRTSQAWSWSAWVLLMVVNVGSVMVHPDLSALPKPNTDGPDYENIAFHLATGRGFEFDNRNPQWRAPYETSDKDYQLHLDGAKFQMSATGRPPLFPAMIALIYRLFGRTKSGFALVRLLLAACLATGGALAVWMTARVLMRAGQSLLVVNVGCAGTLFLAATSRTLRSYAADFLTEPIALLLMQMFVACVVALGTVRLARHRWQALSAAGVAFGFLILTRSMFVVWLPAIALLTMLTGTTDWMSRVREAGWLVAVACLVCLPWWTHNIAVLETWMPLGTQGPIALLGGYCNEAVEDGGDWQFEPEQLFRLELAQSPEFLQLPNDTQREVFVARAASEQVRQWAKENWRELPGLAVGRVAIHWNPYSGRSLIWKLAMLAGAAWLIRSSCTLRLSKKAERIMQSRGRSQAHAAWWLLGLPLTSTLVVAVFYSTGGRFLVPLYGLLFTLGGIGMAWPVQLWLSFRNPGLADRS